MFSSQRWHKSTCKKARQTGSIWLRHWRRIGNTGAIMDVIRVSSFASRDTLRRWTKFKRPQDCKIGNWNELWWISIWLYYWLMHAKFVDLPTVNKWQLERATTACFCMKERTLSLLSALCVCIDARHQYPKMFKYWYFIVCKKHNYSHYLWNLYFF